MPIIEIPEFCTTPPAPEQLAAWADDLTTRGYVVIKDALPPAAVEHFRSRLERMPPSYGYGSNSLVRLFEQGMDFVALLENEPIFSLMKQVLGANMHIIALQGHRMFRGNEVHRWHADEIYLQRPEEVSDDVDYPPIVNVVNCHYYVVDVPEELGPTQLVPYSHKACRRPRPSDGEPPSWRGHAAKSITLEAGDCVMYSNQIWHRGAPNQTDRTRLSVVPGYGRRFVAQRFWPFVNYQIPPDIFERCSDTQKVLLGAHARGAYG